MLSQCFSVLLLFSSLNLTSFTMPEFSYTYLGAHMYNLTCDSIEAHSWQAGINHVEDNTGFHLRQAPTTVLHCETELDYFAYHGRMKTVINMTETAVHLETVTNEECLTVDSILHECTVNTDMTELYASPPSMLIDAVLASARLYVNTNLESYVCDVALPDLQQTLANHTQEPLTPLPELEPGSTDLRDTPIFCAIEHITEVLPLVYGVNVSAVVVGPATLEVSIEFPSGKHIHYAGDVNPLNETGAAMVESPEMWMIYLRAFLNQEESLLDKNLLIPYFPGYVENSNLDVWVPRGARIIAQVDFAHLWCEEPETYRCFVRRVGGIRVSNLRVQNVGDAGTLFMRYSRDATMDSINAKLTNWTNTTNLAGEDSEWFELPMRRRATVTHLPPLFAAVGFVVAATTVSGLLITWGVRRHSNNPVVSLNGEPVSVRRVVIEDALLCLGVVSCIGCFMWSNMTTAATVVIGDELEVYAFSLMSTVVDLWKAGLKPLSVCVFLFSGVYPYFKLVSILVFTVVLQSPDAAVLHVIDYLGKLSLLDTFVMMIMVSGLSVPGIADVHIFAPFYLFVAATIVSIALGNYATCVWRRGTSTKRDILAVIRREARRSVVTVATVDTSGAVDAAEGQEPDVVYDEAAQDDSGAEPEQQRLLSTDPAGRPMPDDRSRASPVGHTVWRWTPTTALGSFALVLLCTLPAWWWPCLEYRLGGLAPLVTSADKAFSLSQLASAANLTCYVVTLATVIIAPCLYAVSSPKWQFLASWCAADALVIACIAGLLQLNQFVQFVLGPGMEDFYNAHAVLLWTLAPLTVAAAFVWLLAGLALCHPSR